MKRTFLALALAASFAAPSFASGPPAVGGGGFDVGGAAIGAFIAWVAFASDQEAGAARCKPLGLYHTLDNAGRPHCVAASQLPWGGPVQSFAPRWPVGYPGTHNLY